MGKEIERKFLVTGDGWRSRAPGAEIRQGYLCAGVERSVRVRTMAGRGFFTVKGKSVGAARPEFEYEIPIHDAEHMLNELCERPLIEKTRYSVDHAGVEWTIDFFAGDNRGLVLAEVELDEEHQSISLPDWVGEEVTGNPRYFNASLFRHPFRWWSSADKGGDRG